MRAAALAAMCLATFACAVPALANTVFVPVPVYLSVTPDCKLQTPNTIALKPETTAAVKLPAGIADALPQVALEMLLADCQTRVKPLLMVAADGRSGAYLATIDF